MTIRPLPTAPIARDARLRADLTPAALERWRPELGAAAADGDEVTISVLDVIGNTYFGEGVTVKRIDAALRAIGDRDVTVNINSPGGDYFEGLAIYNRLRDHKARVTVKILGLAASAASVIAMAGDEVRIARAGFLMIHNTWVVAAGDRHQMREVADWLEPFNGAAVDIYAARSTLDAAAIEKMLDRETWIRGTDAVAKGFADDLLDSDAVTESAAAAAAFAPALAAHKVDALLAQAGVPRAKRRDLIKQLKSGMPGAAAEDTPSAVLIGTRDAAVFAQVNDLLAHVRTL